MGQDHPALQAEEIRRQALIANDTEALSALMAPGLVYVHSTGGRDSRQSYIDSLKKGELRYLEVNFAELQAHPLPGDAAVITGRMKASIIRYGQAREVNSHFMTVWARDEDQHWRLYAHQGTAAN